MPDDPELQVMQEIVTALEREAGLDGQQRILRWLNDRYMSPAPDGQISRPRGRPRNDAVGAN